MNITIAPVEAQHSSFIKQLGLVPKNVDFFAGYPPALGWPSDCAKWWEGSFIVLADEQPVGLLSVTNASYITKQCEFGCVVALPSSVRRDALTQALWLFCDHFFVGLGLHRMYAKVGEDREALRALIEANGFVQEGVLRQSLYTQGRYRNHVLYGMLREEFLERKGQRSAQRAVSQAPNTQVDRAQEPAIDAEPVGQLAGMNISRK